MFHIYVDVPKEKSGRVFAYSVSKMLENTSGASFPEQNRGKINVIYLHQFFSPHKVLEI
jgi:hypothetical protein